MSREIPHTPDRPPHWIDAWQPFHDHWQEILNFPIDPLTMAAEEQESLEGDPVQVKMKNLIGQLAGTGQRGNWERDVRRRIVDELVGGGGRTFGTAVDEIKSLHSSFSKHEREILFGVIKDILYSCVKNRLNLPIVQELIGHAAFKERLPAKFYENDTVENWLVDAMAEAIAVKLGIEYV